MARSPSTPSLAMLLQRFFVDHLQQHRSLSPCTISAYRDTFKLLLHFAERYLGKTPVNLALADLNAGFLLAFLDYWSVLSSLCFMRRSPRRSCWIARRCCAPCSGGE